jgi:hypothetical protein
MNKFRSLLKEFKFWNYCWKHDVRRTISYEKFRRGQCFECELKKKKRKNMTRAIFISAGGDPLLASFCLKLLKERCWDEFDSVYICYNNSTLTPVSAQAEFIDQCLGDEKIKLIYWPTQLGYGLPITKMLQVATEDLICLLEDDGFVFTPGSLEKHFQMIESGEYDALGSPRMSCGAEIAEALKEKYHLDYSGYGDVGPNFWPNFLFCKRKDLLITDGDFAPRRFEKDKFYPSLDHVMDQEEYGDTFVWTSIQMRHNGVRFKEIPQFHASPYEIEDIQKGERNWRGEKPFWMHGGSLSVGAGKYLNNVVPDVSTDIAKQDFETRAAFWMIIAGVVDGFKSYKYTYQKGIEDLINNAGLDRDRIGQKIGIYRSLMQI